MRCTSRFVGSTVCTYTIRLVLYNKSHTTYIYPPTHKCAYIYTQYTLLLDTDDEWRDWNSLGDPVLHIEFRNWADLLLIAPLSAHTLAKLAHGLCDDGLSSVVRAWDFHGGGKPIVLAPAMNTAMWEHPLTQPQLRTLSSWSRTVSIVAPQVKELACGDVGNGALANVDEILVAVGTVLVTNAEKNL